MILWSRKLKTRPQDNCTKKETCFAYFPVFVKRAIDDSAHPDMECSELIWLEKYVDTYRYSSIRKAWVLRKTERVSQIVLDKFAE